MSEEKTREKEIYFVYASILKLHKEFAEIQPFYDARKQFITRIVEIDSKTNSWFSYMMFEYLRKWFLKSFTGIDKASISSFYTDLWHFHKFGLDNKNTDDGWKVILNKAQELTEKYKNEFCFDMVSEILVALDEENK